MAGVRIAPYGSWSSLLSASLAAAGAVELSEVTLDGEDVYWVESRPSEGGRSVVVRRSPSGAVSDVTPPPFNARTRVHEYGGGAVAVADGVVYFSHYADHRIYRHRPGEPPRPVTPEGPWRYADLVVDRGRGRLICVREDHAGPAKEPTNTLLSVPLGGGAAEVLASGYDFYASPCLSPDGSKLAWLCWKHPNLPWDGTELWVADVAPDGSLQHPRRIAGGPAESVFQPSWSPDGALCFVSDRTGWWNLYRWQDGRTEPLYPVDAEFGRPQWRFGLSTYAFCDAHRIVCAFRKHDGWRLAALHIPSRSLRVLPLPYTEVAYVRARGDHAFFVAASPTEPWGVVRCDVETGRPEVLRRAAELPLDPELLSTPEWVQFPTTEGEVAYAWFYPPRNPKFTGPPGERPPLVVFCHGGPTSTASTALRPEVQFWTSRGIAVLDVDYRGSAGYGRAYRDRLQGAWEVADVDDCARGAEFLVERGGVDGRRLAIRGGSAGGYTTLAVLAFRDVFRAGASYFGVSDLEALHLKTHKFESRYLERLVGPYPARRDLFLARSPLYAADRIRAPVIFFQGLDDRVVPPEQSERMYRTFVENGVPTAYLAFEGEGHGFRRAETIRRCLEAELDFYGKVLGFAPADAVEPAPIQNL